MYEIIYETVMDQLDEQQRESRIAKPQSYRSMQRRANLCTEKALRLYRKEGIDSVIKNFERKEKKGK